MNINNEILNKYNVPNKELFEGKNDICARMFLQNTDHIPLKIFESFIENMASASLAETFVVVLKFFKDVKVTYAEVLQARKVAREEINRLEQEVSDE